MKRLNFIRNIALLFLGLPSIIKSYSIKKEIIDRKVEYYDKDRGWTEIKFEDIKKGMYVQMFEPDGESIVMGYRKNNSNPIYGTMVIKDAYLNNEGIWTFIHKTIQ